MTEKPLQPCPYVSCGSSDAFSWNTDGYGFCHSCGRGYPSREPTYGWAKEVYPVSEWKEPGEVKKVTYKGIRGIDEDVAKMYGIQRHLDEDGNWVRDAFKYSNNVKYKLATPPGAKKKFDFKQHGVSVLDLFGPDFNAGTSKRIYITEGEYDAASLFQVLGKTYPVKGLPSGSFGDKFMKHNYEYLSTFEQIVYAGEQDTTGKKAIDRFYQAFPEKLYFVPMTKWKDANEFLENGDGEDLKWAALKPQRYSPDNFFCSDQEFEAILREENPYEATPTGHSGIDYHCRGLVRGGVTFIKALPGVGKTEIVRYFERAMLNTDDIKVGMIHMEEMKSTTLRCMATYELNTNVRTKEDALENNVPEEKVIEAALKAAKGDRTIIFEMRIEDDPLKIIEYVKLAAGVYGADYVFIDHIQRLTYLGGTDGATNVLTQIASNLAQISKELNIGVVIISHINEDGSTKYAKSLEEEAIILLKVDRDKDNEDDIIRNTINVEVQKNRPFSKLGNAGKLYYDPEITVLEEVT